MISCKETTRLLSDSLDRRLSLPERMALKSHLFMCKFCRRFSRQVKFLREVATRYLDDIERRPFTPSSLSLEAREKIKLAIAEKTNT